MIRTYIDSSEKLLDKLPVETAELVTPEDGSPPTARFVMMQFHPQTLEQLRTARLKAGEAILPWALASKMCTDFIQAELHLQSLFVLHRDIKPDNVLVKEDGSLCLCDFGEALEVRQLF
jgi:serine/threonine protein kinase